ncbi:MAG: pyruvate dehydrogenase (acetyl-transferring) E1 component subunit alpha [Chloroflexi bacterium]|jgi:pyruvate dehydrogenase E1 component alpha subunit|nr:pyruvate dehydrogenase (acetyl-transferring) E1 component subunit alpha [Chloroflexota bacterium]
MAKGEYLDLYKQMVLIRHLEEKAAELYQAGKVGGFLHLYIGEEAVSTGIFAAREARDHVITAYRDHGVAVNSGIPVKNIMAELMGKATGISKGRGGSMHMADISRNYWGGHAVVGAHIPIASGLALADKMEENQSVTLCMFGEGATNIGFFHEGVNLAMVWKLPVLWICENNQYGMGTSPERASAVSKIIQKACGYGMPAYDVDGMDVLAVRDMVAARLKEIREGSGPQFIEVCTYRFKGHSMGDPERYRTKAEVKKYVENGPIDRFRKFLMEKNSISEKTLNEIDKEVEKEIQEAVEFAENSPEPADEDLFKNIYVEE